jgi:hypothetical protein
MGLGNTLREADVDEERGSCDDRQEARVSRAVGGLSRSGGGGGGPRSSGLIRLRVPNWEGMLAEAGIGTSVQGTQFTCFTSTKVQILTPEERCRRFRVFLSG